MASRPTLSQRRSTSSVVQLAKRDSNDEGDVESSPTAHKRPAKQFVVHSRHHRVPSGRNLKKLAGTRSHSDLVALAQVAAAQQQQEAQEAAAATANQGSKAHSTSPVPPWERIKEKEARQSGGHELKRRSRSNPKRSLSTPIANSKKATFEFASAPGSFEDTADQLAQAELEDAMNQGAAEKAYMGQVRPVTPSQSDVPDVSARAQLESEEQPLSDVPDIQPPLKRTGKQPERSVSTIASDVRQSATAIEGFTSSPTEVLQTASGMAVAANGTPDRADTTKMNTPATTKMNTPATPQPLVAPKLDKHPRSSPPFHAANRQPTVIPPQISNVTATTHNEGRRSMSSASSGPAPQLVTSRFISSSSSPSGALSTPSSVRDTPMKKRTSVSFESPPTPHATPPSSVAPLATATPGSVTTLNHDAIFRKSGSTNIGAGKQLPNRTQTKILLQRQSSQAEWEQERQQQQQQAAQLQNGQLYYASHARRGSMNIGSGAGGSGDGENMRLPREAVREVERISREYANVRRFVSPVGESVVRLKGLLKSHRVPQQQGRRSLERDGSGPASLGLSQSLGANVESRRDPASKAMAGVSGGGSRDDSGLASRTTGGMDEAKIRELLIHVWNRDEPGGSNLSSSN
ncbi:hypothetical protein DRE_03873 [Drechslerella stenobrocha 248]|uniref:Uncharacterized protein n=1 Tax=Drechslerella stenobrocha 248 TaxID=1043628 RepID=W7HS06_9PEZI|nr:hypothetical protein DRE_03873 [Drechslerella stenobrocha 248]